MSSRTQLSPPPPDTQDPHVLRCRSTADFLAALPQLAGFTATDSLFLVLFDGRRAEQAVRIDLPADDSPHASLALLEFLCDVVREHAVCCGELSAPAIVISCSQRFADADGIPWQRLAGRIERRLRRERIGVRELCCVAPDGWAGYLAPHDRSSCRPLSEIAESPLAIPAAEGFPTLEELGTLPEVPPRRQAAISRQLEAILPYDFPVPGLPSPVGSGPGNTSRQPGAHGWVAATTAVLRAIESQAHSRSVCDACCGPALSDVDSHGPSTHAACDESDARNAPAAGSSALSARMTARLIRSACHADRWLLLAIGLVTRAEFPRDLVREFGEARFTDVPIDDAEHHGPYWSIRFVLLSLCLDKPAARRLANIRPVLLTALAEAPAHERARLYALSAWVWWASGGQTVALQHAEAATRIAPEDSLVRMVAVLVDSPLSLSQAFGVPMGPV